MLDKGILFIAVLTVVSLAATAFVLQASTAVSVDDKAPDFTLPKVAGEGNINLYKSLNKPTLLVFWASWCPHCRREMPVVQELYKDLKSKGMNAVGVSLDKTTNSAEDYIKDNSISFPNAYAGGDKGKKVVDAYGLKGIPAIYVLDKKGVIKARYIGQVDEDVLREDFAELGVK